MNSHSINIIPYNGNVIIRRETRASGDMVCKGIVVYKSYQFGLDYNVGDIVYFENVEATRLEDDLLYIPEKAIIAIKKKEQNNETESVNS